MTNRDKTISLYVTQERKNNLERRAEAENLAVSKYLNQVIDRQMQMEAENEVSAQTRATEQLQRVIDDGERQLREVVREIADMNAKMGVYAVANFELLKNEYKDAYRRDALKTGSRRLRADVDETIAELDSDADDDDEDSGLDIDALENRGDGQ